MPREYVTGAMLPPVRVDASTIRALDELIRRLRKTQPLGRWSRTTLVRQFVLEGIETRAAVRRAGRKVRK